MLAVLTDGRPSVCAGAQDHMARPEPGAAPGASQADGPVWGHWVSKDLVTFAQLDVALWNGAADGTDSFDDVAIYTGASAAHNYMQCAPTQDTAASTVSFRANQPTAESSSLSRQYLLTAMCG